MTPTVRVRSMGGWGNRRPDVAPLSWSDFLRRDEAGTVVMESRTAIGGTPPPAVWSPALPPHSLENVGATEIRVISMELKQVVERQDRTLRTD